MMGEKGVSLLLLINHKSSSNNTQAAKMIASKNLGIVRGFK